MVEVIQLLAGLTALITQVVSLLIVIQKLQKSRQNRPTQKRAARRNRDAR